MEERMNKRKLGSCIAYAAAFLLIVSGGFLLSMPHTIGMLKDIRTWGVMQIVEILPTFEEDYNAAFPRRTDFINLNGLMARVLQKRELNEVTKYSGGQLGKPLAELDEAFVAEMTNNLAAFYAYLDERSIGLTYVLIPSKGAMYDSEPPAGIADYAKENARIMGDSFRACGVDVLDLPVLLEQAGMDSEETFLKTDHHWKPETAFWACGEIMRHLHDQHRAEYDPALCDISNYQVDVYPRIALGSQGKRTGVFFSGIDDFSVIYPKFDTQMTATFVYGNEERSGSFYETNIYMRALLPVDYFDKISFCTYIGYDYPLVLHRNNAALSDRRVLLVKDSFSLPLQAFLTLHFQQMDVIDPRYFTAETIADYIERTRPDEVLLCYNVMAADRQFFTFGTENAVAD